MSAINVGVIGRTGQLARALGEKSVANAFNIKCYGREYIDLSSPAERISDFVNSLDEIDVLINAAAYTKVDQAEDDVTLANLVNAESPGVLSKSCADRGIPMVHISTDYVFSGQKTMPYEVTDTTNPLGVYGSSKLAGEKFVLNENKRSVVLRTSWVYDGVGKNFFTTMLNLAKTSDTVGVVSDQFGRPTYAGHLANATLQVANLLTLGKVLKSGVFHVSGNGEIIHWAKFAKSIFEMTQSHRTNTIAVNNILSSEFPTKAERPSYSALDNSFFEQEFQFNIPNWREGLKEAYVEWASTQTKEIV